MSDLSAEAREWVRSGAPTKLRDFDFPAGGSWPVEAGKVCDFASVPLSLGREMLALSRRDADHPLGPILADQERATLMLALGAAKRLPGVLMCTVGAPSGVMVVQGDVIVRVPPPTHSEQSGLTWLQPPIDGAPFLPGVGTFAYLATIAARHDERRA